MNAFICSNIGEFCEVCAEWAEYACDVCDRLLCADHAVVPLLRADDRKIAGDDIHLCPACTKRSKPLRVRVER